MLAVNLWCKRKKNKGPNTEPCGTPAFRNFQLEEWLFKTTFWRLLWRNDSIKWRRFIPFIPLFFSLRRKTLCQTLSNAFDKFKKTPRTSNDGLPGCFLSRTSNDGLPSNALKILWVIEISWWTQESFGLKPDWVLLSRLFSIINSKMASKTSFPKSLEEMGSKDTGRYLSTIYLLTFLCTGTTLSFFKSSGKVPNLKQLLNIMRSGFIMCKYILTFLLKYHHDHEFYRDTWPTIVMCNLLRKYFATLAGLGSKSRPFLFVMSV